MKTNLKLQIIGTVIFLCLLILALLFLKISKENAECQSDPFIYSAIKSSKQGMDIQCWCIPFDPKYRNFYFDKYGIGANLNDLESSKNESISLLP